MSLLQLAGVHAPNQLLEVIECMEWLHSIRAQTKHCHSEQSLPCASTGTLKGTGNCQHCLANALRLIVAQAVQAPSALQSAEGAHTISCCFVFGAALSPQLLAAQFQF